MGGGAQGCNGRAQGAAVDGRARMGRLREAGSLGRLRRRLGALPILGLVHACLVPYTPA